jgi:hypothetical protein
VWGTDWNAFMETSDFDTAWGSVPRPGIVVTEREIREDPILRPLFDEWRSGDDSAHRLIHGRRSRVDGGRGGAELTSGGEMTNSDSQVESSNPASNPARTVPPTFSSFFRPRMLFAVLGVVLVIGVVSIMSRSEALAVVPHLIGERVDPQLDRLPLLLAAADLTLGDVSVAPCPEFDIPGVSLARVPGTIIDQHPAGGENVVLSTAVDVTVCLSGSG